MIDRRTILGMLLASLPAAACAQQTKATTLTVYKSPYCGCCSEWVEHLRASGFNPVVREMEDVSPVADKLGVPTKLRSCHTATIGGYFVEGHVPASDIRKLLSERPKARGISVPGMPAGSPGMEQSGHAEPFTTVLISLNGTARPFARHRATGA